MSSSKCSPPGSKPAARSTPPISTSPALIVDDNTDNAELMAELPRPQGHDCRTVGTVREALAVVETFELDAALLDIGLSQLTELLTLKRRPGSCSWWRAGRLPRGAMLKFYFATESGYLGAPFGLPPTRLSLDAYLAMLEGCDLPWAVSVVGGDVVASEVAPLALERGGHLHLGLEFYGGDRVPKNVDLVEEAVALCARFGRPVATPAQAARILNLPR